MEQKQLTNEQVGSVCMSMTHLLHSGIGFADALILLSADEQEADCREKLKAMADAMDQGFTFTQALNYAGGFPQYVCTLSAVGEKVGRLEETLEALAAYYQGRARLEVQIKRSLVYPAVLMLVVLAVMTALLVWVLPVFDQVYAQLGSGLTGFAGWLLALGMGIKQALPVLLGVGILAVVMLAVPQVCGKMANIWQAHGHLPAQIRKARFVQMLALGISSGMTPQEAAVMTEDKNFPGCVASLERGEALSKVLREEKILSHAQCRVLEAGERSGRGAQILESMAQQLLWESEDALQRQAEKLEPAMVIASCLLIGGVLLAVLLPLIHLMSGIGL